MGPEVTVLRLGHRPQRDKRLTTHVCLAARAFGARRIVLTNHDASVVESVEGIVERFGGPFDVEVVSGWREYVRAFDGPSLHLTMYGEPHTAVAARVRDADRLLLVVGAEKVPGDLYDLVTHNVAVGNQPHSEVAALAATLLEMLGTAPLTRPMEGGRLVIEPRARGKEVRPKGPGAGVPHRDEPPSGGP